MIATVLAVTGVDNSSRRGVGGSRLSAITMTVPVAGARARAKSDPSRAD
jgi:hypothetical protein